MQKLNNSNHASLTESVGSNNKLSIHSLLDSLAIPIVLFHDDCEVCMFNRAAEEFIGQRHWLWIADNRLRCRDIAIASLDKHLHHCKESVNVSVEPLVLTGTCGGKVLLGGFVLLADQSLIACTLVDPYLTHMPRPGALQQIFGLTDAESDVTAMIAAGKDYQQIADKRNVSVATVRTCTKSIFKKLGVKSRAGVVGTAQSATLPLGVLSKFPFTS